MSVLNDIKKACKKRIDNGLTDKCFLLLSPNMGTEVRKYRYFNECLFTSSENMYAYRIDPYKVLEIDEVEDE